MLLPLALFNCKLETAQVAELQIIPRPMSQELISGQFILDSNVGLLYGNEFQISAEFLKSFIENDTLIK